MKILMTTETTWILETRIGSSNNHNDDDCDINIDLCLCSMYIAIHNVTDTVKNGEKGRGKNGSKNNTQIGAKRQNKKRKKESKKGERGV